MSKLSADRRVKRAHIDILRKEEFQFLGGILMIGGVEVVSDKEWEVRYPGLPPTACTNGRDVTYAEGFIDALTDKALRFLILHENYHKMYRHMTTWEKLWKICPQTANEACDYVINDHITLLDEKEEFLEFPTIGGKAIGCRDVRFRGMHVKQVWDILRQEQEKNGGGGGGKGEPMDFHDWADAQGLSEQEKKELEREIDQAIRQGQIAQKKAGTGSGSMDRALQELLEPKVDWREVLREFVQSTCAAKDVSSWRRVSRRHLGSDVYMPSLVGESVGHMVLAVDMSGSTWVGNVFRDFMSEVVGLCKMVNPDKVDLVYWDTAIGGVEHYKCGDYDSMAATTRPVGGGGTSVSCVSDWIKKEKVTPDCVVVLTDLYLGADYGKFEQPVLWVVAGECKDRAPYGQTIHIGDDYEG